MQRNDINDVPVHAGIWGLCRALRAERPDLKVICLDVAAPDQLLQAAQTSRLSFMVVLVLCNDRPSSGMWLTDLAGDKRSARFTWCGVGDGVETGCRRFAAVGPEAKVPVPLPLQPYHGLRSVQLSRASQTNTEALVWWMLALQSSKLWPLRPAAVIYLVVERAVLAYSLLGGLPSTESSILP